MWSLRRQSKKQHLSLMNKECYLVSGGQRVSCSAPGYWQYAWEGQRD